MKFTALDPCLVYKHGKNGLEGLQVMQVDDICGERSPDFPILETRKAEILNSEPQSSNLSLKLIGLCIDKFSNEGYQLY